MTQASAIDVPHRSSVVVETVGSHQSSQHLCLLTFAATDTVMGADFDLCASAPSLAAHCLSDQSAGDGAQTLLSWQPDFASIGFRIDSDGTLMTCKHYPNLQ